MIKLIFCFAFLITVISGELYFKIIWTFKHTKIYNLCSGESGKCTWIGEQFDGHTTACGKVLHSTEMTASSNTLPCNTMVKVTANDKTITVKVTDKGSLGPGIILSLTKAAAAELEIVAQGVAPCTVVEV